MKKELVHLMKKSPGFVDRSADFLDTVADDLQAVMTRAIHPANTDAALAALEQEVEDVYLSDFGVHLFNLYTIEDFPGKKPLSFSARKRLIRAMIQTLLVEQCIDYDCDVDDVPALFSGVTDGNMLKRRLQELSATPKPGEPVN